METTSVLPRGYVFAPTDSELLGYFLFSKIQNPTVQFEEIQDPNNIYEYVPDILTKKQQSQRMVFFSRVNKKHANGSRLSRSIAGQKGFWRASTGEKKVRGCNGQLLGKTTSLNYYEGKNSKTDWIMQEYILAPPQDHRTPNKFEDYALCKIYQKGSKASTNKSSTVIGHQLREISYNFNSVCAKEGLEEDYMVPQLPYYDQDVHVNSFSSDFCDIDTEEVFETLIQAAFNSPDDREPNAGVEVERMTTTEVAAADMDADVEEKLQCDFNTTHHHDVVALPNVESMVETTEVLEEEEGVDWLRDFPQFEPADLEFSDLEVDAWDNEFVRVSIFFLPSIFGPILFEDYHLVEKLANFDRERIPERVVHARGASAKGFFEVTHDISHLSCADFLRAPGVQTPLIVRFSTVIHERGSPETLRDPRGFAVKFYTREFEDYALCKIYQKGSKASTSKSSTVIDHQLREISYNFNSVCAKEGLEEDYMVPQVPYYDQYINVGEAQGGTINSEEAMLPLMIVNQGHPSSISTIRTYRRQRRKHGITNNIASTSINCVALPNVESMVETTEVLEEQRASIGYVTFPNLNRRGFGIQRLGSPILLEDYHLVEKLANFDRERIPERVVHARGASAKGFFEVTHDISSLLCGLPSCPGVQTPLIVRFSTVIHERGSPETLRDPRGFAVKFYTREGNFDLVGNNFPVFFIRDGMKFPDMVHALKPNPKSHIQENWRVLDFFSHHPESLHMFTFLFDDIGIPQDYRHMDGSGVNTYTLINKAGKAHYDLNDSIAAGNYPEWKLFIQIIDLDHEDKFDFDPLDVTKTWPEDILPLMPVGRMVLNKNVDNFFAENEQLAFCPGVIVPSVYYSDDKLLQTRVFSYSDIQRHRLGPNYLLLPANAPKCAHHNNHHEGFMNFMHRDEEVNYFPSRFDPVRHAETYPIPPNICRGKREKCIIEKENNFKQPGERYRSFTPERQDWFIQRWVEALSDPRVTHEIRSIWARNCSTNLACRGRCWFVRRTGRGWWRFALWRGKGVVAVRVLEDPDQLQGMARSKKLCDMGRDSNTVGLRGGHRGRRPQTASYRKSKESTRVTNASDVAEVHDETSAVNASVTATAGKEIEVHKSQVTTAETSSSDSIEEEQDESQEQEVDGEEAEQSK
ncbi:hypothetical protein Sjap_017512 [Stephania japonica]|uniref:catalase n=1 Tax=Stephania japonica TaxID=461633 RepID=A0AAP0I6B5_9MAGN